MYETRIQQAPIAALTIVLYTIIHYVEAHVLYSVDFHVKSPGMQNSVITELRAVGLKQLKYFDTT